MGKTLKERMEECGRSSHLIQRAVDCASGEERVRYLGEVPVSRGNLIEAKEAGRLPVGINLEVVEVKVTGYSYLKVLLRGAGLSARLVELREWTETNFLGEDHG